MISYHYHCTFHREKQVSTLRTLSSKRTKRFVRTAIFHLLVSAVLVECGYLIYQIFVHIGHVFYWAHYGWWITAVLVVAALAVDLITDDVIEDRWFFDIPPDDQSEHGGEVIKFPDKRPEE